MTIPSLSLQQLISTYNLSSTSILKIDCEGDEYKILFNSSEDVLRTFDFILLEYHYGYKNLKKYLESCGFDVHITPPLITGQIPWLLQFFKKFSHSTNKPKLGATGLMFAKRIPK